MSHCCKIYSMIISFLDIFKIDRLGKGIFSKVIFTFGLLAGMSVYFFPLGDNDFTRLILMMQSMMTDMDAFMNAPVYEIPLSTGNIIYLLHVIASYIALIMCAILYSAVYVRQYRTERKDENKPGITGFLIPPKYLIPSGMGKMLLRMVIVFCFLLLLFIPASMMLLYLFLIFIMILPYICIYPICYLSGDAGFFESFSEMIRVTKGYYLVNIRIMMMIVTLFFAGSWLTSWLMSFIPSVAYVTGPMLNIFLSLCFGRYVGMIYCIMREVPGGLRIRN